MYKLDCSLIKHLQGGVHVYLNKFEIAVIVKFFS